LQPSSEEAAMLIDPTYADRLRATIARKIKLRGTFTSQGLTEDNEREIYKAQDALRALPVLDEAA
jgi:hypothetical protein